MTNQTKVMWQDLLDFTDDTSAEANYWKSKIVRAVNSHDELLVALKTIIKSQDDLCYCDDYKKPDVCDFCQAKQAITNAEKGE